MATDPATIQQPKHPLYALTTSELSDQRRQLENAIAYYDRRIPCRRRGATCKPGLMT
jgi:hypothetical protein